jgi:hypothetical protein
MLGAGGMTMCWENYSAWKKPASVSSCAKQIHTSHDLELKLDYHGWKVPTNQMALCYII